MRRQVLVDPGELTQAGDGAAGVLPVQPVAVPVEDQRARVAVADGLVEQDGLEIRVKPHARPLVRSIAAAFDAHLAGADRHSRAV